MLGLAALNRVKCETCCSGAAGGGGMVDQSGGMVSILASITTVSTGTDTFSPDSLSVPCYPSPHKWRKWIFCMGVEI